MVWASAIPAATIPVHAFAVLHLACQEPTHIIFVFSFGALPAKPEARGCDPT